MASEACSVCGEEADTDELDPHGHFSLDDDEHVAQNDGEHVVSDNDGDQFSDDDGNQFASEEDYFRSLKQEDSYTFTYSFEYIAKNYGNDKYDIDTADMVVQVDWNDAQAAYLVSYDIPDMHKIDPGQGNSDAKGFYDSDVYWKLTDDLDYHDITRLTSY